LPTVITSRKIWSFGAQKCKQSRFRIFIAKTKKNILLTLHFFHLSILANQLLQHQNKSVASSPKYFRGLALQKAL
jgi:hypothetical protein